MAAPSPVMGLSPGGAEESSEQRESSDNIEYRQLLKDYHETQADLSSTRLNAKMLRAKLDTTHDALHFSMTEVSKAQVNWRSTWSRAKT